MFLYKEEVSKGRRWEKPVTEKTVVISKGNQPIGCITCMTYDEDGRYATDQWHCDSPIEVCYYTEISGRYHRTNHIGYARNIAEGKKVFADWYAEHSGETQHADIRVLPASPDAEFFPTPTLLAGKMASMIDWRKVDTFLEPSAGKGDLIECAVKCFYNKSGRHYRDDWFTERFDCIERDANLQLILKGKGYRVVSDDFLTYFTMKRYDAIIMNPPFSNGDEHLLKAISMQRDSGGQIVCLLNAETIRNPYTDRRKVLQQQLQKYDAKIEFVSGAFSRAERRSDVEVAIVYLNIPEPRRESSILEQLKQAERAEGGEHSNEVEDLVAGDWIDQMVSGYEMEAKLGVALMREYNALSPYIMSGTGEYAKPLIGLSVNGHDCDHATSDTINAYLRKLRYKYWETLLSRRELTEKMTSQLQSEYHDKIREMQDYDFSRYNIKTVIMEISAQLSRGVEDSIYKLFDELSAEHAWYPECEKNVHYYNGWATNKAHKVGMKVILPINGFYAGYSGKTIRAYEFAEKIADIERSMNYLDRGETSASVDPYYVAKTAEQLGHTNMNFKYFSATFYKKGTCHIKFNPDAERIIDRLNIFAARGRQWLPPDYGKKRYADMDDKSRAVIDEFQGEAAYAEVMKAPQNYIISPATSMPLLTA